MTLRALAAAAVIGAVVAAPVGSSTAVGTWTREPPLRQARAAHAVVVAGGSIWALGGTGPRGAPVLGVERFDGQQWRVETQLPVAGGLNATAAATLGSRIYVLGGFEGTSNTPTGRVHVYDLRTRAWSEAAPLPAPRGGHAAVVLGGRIHVLGGGKCGTDARDALGLRPEDGSLDDPRAAAPSEGKPGGRRPRRAHLRHRRPERQRRLRRRRDLRPGRRPLDERADDPAARHRGRGRLRDARSTSSAASRSPPRTLSATFCAYGRARAGGRRWRRCRPREPSPAPSPSAIRCTSSGAAACRRRRTAPRERASSSASPSRHARASLRRAPS